MNRTQIYLSESQHAALAALARARSTTASAIIRTAIDGYLASQLSPRDRVDALRSLASRLAAGRASSSDNEPFVDGQPQVDGDRVRSRG
jgi:predicted transcriptional regulator